LPRRQQDNLNPGWLRTKPGNLKTLPYPRRPMRVAVEVPQSLP
jgi:hypothetical protein